MKRTDQHLLEFFLKIGELFIAADLNKKKRGVAKYIQKELVLKLVFVSEMQRY